MQYNTVQYSTVQYNTIQYNTIQYNTIQYNTIQYNTIQYNTIQYNIIFHNFLVPEQGILFGFFHSRTGWYTSPFFTSLDKEQIHLYKTFFSARATNISAQNSRDSEWNLNSVKPAEKQLCTFL